MSEQKWQLVPVEPTEEMLRPLDRFMRPEAARELLKEVLAAAPQPPAHELLASLERFECDGEDFVKLHDVRDVVAMIKQPPALGGEPEVFAYYIHPIGDLERGGFLKREDAKIADPSKSEHHGTVVLVDRGHVARLQAEAERLKEITCTSMGVGDGNGQLIVHGDYDSIKAAQRILWERDDLKARTAELEGRLHKATAFVQGLRDAAGSQPSVATGYLQDILDELSSAEGAKS